MDVLDHLITVLRTVLDYVGVDFEDIPHPEWYRHREELSIRYRSLVRLIATLLPPKPARRLHLQPTLICQNDQYCNSFETIYASFTDDPVDDDLDLNSDDLVWVEEDLGNNCIQMRAKNRQHVNTHKNLEEMDKGLFVLRQFPDMQTSTPINQSLSFMSQTDPAALTKISALEDEMTKLRLQIAQIVIAQENTTLHKSTMLEQDSASLLVENRERREENEVFTQPEPIPDTPEWFSEAEVNWVTPPPVPLLPPPPSAACIPPPPPLPQSTTQTDSVPVQQAKPSLGDMLTQKRGAFQHRELGSETPSSKRAMSLTDVLQGIGSVKLRSIQRSPGGTPARAAPKQVAHTDPTFLIAQALKKKFAFRNIHDSPDTDKENDFSSSSTETTPKGVPYLLRKKLPRRRSSLCTDSTDMSTPLREKNIRI